MIRDRRNIWQFGSYLDQLGGGCLAGSRLIWLGIAYILANVSLAAQCLPSDLQLTNLNISSGTSLYQATTSIEANTNVTVSGSASMTFQAGNTITLGPGFQATAGTASTTFNASIVPSLGTLICTTVTTSPTGLSISVDNENYTSPRGFSWAAGSVHTISVASPQSGGSGVQYAFSSWSDSGAESHTITVSSSTTTYTATFTTQYFLTTTASSGGTITPAPPGAWYASGSQPSVSATPNSGYTFTGFSGALNGATTPQNVTMNAAKAVGASFAPTLTYPPPTSWNAINYYPLNQSFNEMLWNWNTVAANVNNDLSMLHANGFNVLHLYLWDNTILAKSTSRTGLAPINGLGSNGFCSDPSVHSLDPFPCSNGDPSTSADATGVHGALFNNLDAFLTAAQNNHLYVILEFANGYVTDEGYGLVAPANCSIASVTSTYQTWMNKFVDYFEPRHNNILGWGLGFGWGLEGSANSCSDQVWANSYNNLKSEIGTQLSQYWPSLPLLNNVLVALSLQPLVPNVSGYSQSAPDTEVIPRGSGYSYNWSCTSPVNPPSTCVAPVPPTSNSANGNLYGAQQLYYYMQSLGINPDYFEPSGYNANAGDLLSTLIYLGDNIVTAGARIPMSKIFFSEFGISSGLSEMGPPTNWYPYLADKQVPVTSRAGQSQWLKNTLCAFQAAGVTKQAYWNLYDPYVYWTHYWQETGGPLSFDAYFGLIDDSGTYKSGWSTLTSYYAGTLSCPVATPVLEIHVDSPSLYYTVNEPFGLYWTVTDQTALTLSGDGYTGGSNPCLPGGSEYASNLDGACGWTLANGFSSTGNPTITMTAYNGSSTQAQQSITLTIGNAPTISSVTNVNAGNPITPSSTMLISGAGFANRGGNVVWLHSTSTGIDYYLCNTGDFGYQFNNGTCLTNDPGFTDTTGYQITAPVNGVPSGSYLVYVQNSYTPTWSSYYNLTIQ